MILGDGFSVGGELALGPVGAGQAGRQRDEAERYDRAGDALTSVCSEDAQTR